MNKPIIPQMPEARRDEHYVWREKVSKHLPELSARIFALRGKMYAGCGFDYDLEYKLGRLISNVNNFQGNTPNMMGAMIEKIVFKEILKTLIRNEFSAKGWNFHLDEHRPERFNDKALHELSWSCWASIPQDHSTHYKALKRATKAQ